MALITFVNHVYISFSVILTFSKCPLGPVLSNFILKSIWFPNRLISDQQALYCPHSSLPNAAYPSTPFQAMVNQRPIKRYQLWRLIGD